MVGGCVPIRSVLHSAINPATEEEICKVVAGLFLLARAVNPCSLTFRVP